MALTLKLAYSNVNDGSDCNTLVLDDDTGVYDAVTNPGGYQDEGDDASGHPKRSELAVYTLLTKKNPESADADITFTNVDSDADTTTSWPIPITQDGWYRGQIIAIPFWVDSIGYAVNQIIWYSDVLYKIVATTAPAETPVGSPAKFEVFESTAANMRLVYDDPITYGPSATIETGYLDLLQHCFGDETYADAWKDVSDDRPSFYSKDSAIAITAFLEGAKIAAARENFQEADRKILIVQALGNNPNCKIC
jgi:hypothetical protein